MSKKNRTKLLLDAEKIFLNGNYQHSLINYGLILKDYPETKEARLGVYLSDLGLEDDTQAQALFDYYQIIKEDNENPITLIENIIDNITTHNYQISNILSDIEKDVNNSDGMGYDDFLKLVDSKGNFKVAFEDIMFSTKVILTNKIEFIDFVHKLYKEGFKDMALRYLDSSFGLFGNDKEVLSLYEMVKEEQE